MSIRIKPYKRHGKEGTGWEADMRLKRSNGEKIRERIQVPPEVKSKSAAMRWAELRATQLIEHGRPTPALIKKEVPTVAEFAPRFLMEFCEAERQKPSGINAKKIIFRKYLVPLLGSKRLDAITREDVQLVKTALIKMKPKTVNNVLTTLGKMLHVAEEWDVIEEMPCRVRLLKQQGPEMQFYDFVEYERLVEAAEKINGRIHVAVLLGGDAGLRSGEMTALEWSDIDFRQGIITVARSEWKQQVTLPKGGRSRKVPMTTALASALQKLKHLRGPRVFWADRGGDGTQKVLRIWMAAAQKRAGLKANGGVHILRHTFCSHLAMKGAPTRAIQELAGHANIGTTQRYMHLSPAAKDSAIRLLNDRGGGGQGEAEPLPSPGANQFH